MTTTKKSFKIHTLLLLTVALLTGASQQNMFSQNSLSSVKRYLQDNGSFGGYVINRGKLPEECADYTYEEIQYTDQEFKDGMASLTMFSFVRDGIDAYVKNEDEEEIKKQAIPAAVRAAASVIFFLLAFVMFFFFIIYFFCNCLSKVCSCLCCCCDDDDSLKDKDGDSDSEKRKKAKKRAKRSKKIKKMASDSNKKMIIGCSLVLVVALTVLGIIWGVFMFNSIGGVRRTSCSVGHTFENIKEGVKNDDITFGGLKGMRYLLDKIGESLDNIQASDLTAITTADLDTKGNDAFDTLGPFHASKTGDRTQSCATGTAASITPDHIANLTPTFNDEVAKEFQSMKDNGAELDKAAADGAEAVGAQKQAYLDTINQFKE